MDAKKLGQDISYMLNGLGSLNEEYQKTTMTEFENKIYHISWKAFNSDEIRAQFIQGLTSEATYKDLWTSLAGIKTALLREYGFLKDDSVVVDSLDNNIEVFEDIMHKAILQQMQNELMAAYNSAKHDMELNRTTFRDNPEFFAINVEFSNAKATEQSEVIKMEADYLKQNVIPLSMVERQIEQLKVLRKHNKISTVDYASKMSELRELSDYYTIADELAKLDMADKKSDLELAINTAKSKFDGVLPVNTDFYNQRKEQNQAERLVYNDDLFEAKKKIDFRANNKALADGQITEEQWRTNMANISSSISPLQMEEMKKRVSESPNLNSTQDIPEQNSGFTM